VDVKFSVDIPLVEATKLGQISTITDLLVSGVSSDDQKRALYFAVKEGDLEAVRLLLETEIKSRSPRASNYSDGVNLIGYHLLEMAVTNGHVEIVKALLQNGAAIYLTEEVSNTRDDQTILMLATQDGYLDIVKLLVEAGANVNITRQNNDNALLSAARNGYQAVFDYLSPLTHFEFHIEALEVLPAGIRSREFEDNADPQSCALTHAIMDGDLDQVQEVLDSGVNVNALDDLGSTPLMYAALKRLPEIVKRLLEAGANPNLPDGEDGRTPLMVASGPVWENESTIICRLLLAAGGEVNAYDSEGQTPLMHTVFPFYDYEPHKRDRKEYIVLLLEAGADVNARNIKTGQTALMQVLQTDARQDERADKQDIIITLLNAGADLRLEDYTGKRIIQRSTLPYDLEVIN
jgi:uncharacterized protein